jgi:hypothetical protein
MTKALLQMKTYVSVIHLLWLQRRKRPPASITETLQLQARFHPHFILLENRGHTQVIDYLIANVPLMCCNYTRRIAYQLTSSATSAKQVWRRGRKVLTKAAGEQQFASI